MARFKILAPTAIAGLMLAACSSPEAPPAAPAEQASTPKDQIIGYESAWAMDLSGQMVPPEVNGYYFIEIVDDASDAQYVDEIRDLLDRAHADEDYLGIISRDAHRMRELVLTTLADVPAGSLSDATVIMIGRVEDETPLRKAVESSGAEFRYGVYVARDAPVL